jgi:hypothetical protein
VATYARQLAVLSDHIVARTNYKFPCIAARSSSNKNPYTVAKKDLLFFVQAVALQTRSLWMLELGKTNLARK